MRTLRPEFQEAFVKQCFDRGMSEDLTRALFQQAHLQDLLENDPDFRAGWDQEIKRAGVGDAAQALISPEVKGFAVGAPIGGLAAGIAAAKKMKGPVWAKGLAGAAGFFGGGALGSWSMAPSKDYPNGPAMADQYLPDALRPAAAGGDSHDTESLLSIPNTGITGRSGSGAGTPAGPTAGSQMIRQTNEQVQNLNRDLDAAREQEATALKTTGIQGSAQAMDIRRRIAELEQQKAKILNSSDSFFGRMRNQQGQSLRSLDQAQEKALAARAVRQPRADAMDRWIRNGDQGSLLYRLINHITGAQNQASHLSSQMRNIDEGIKTIDENRTRVNDMLLPGT
jgi:hypothetical protein